MSVRILRSAKETITEGMRFYDRLEAGLGETFLHHNG